MPRKKKPPAKEVEELVKEPPRKRRRKQLVTRPAAEPTRHAPGEGIDSGSEEEENEAEVSQLRRSRRAVALSVNCGSFRDQLSRRSDGRYNATLKQALSSSSSDGGSRSADEHVARVVTVTAHQDALVAQLRRQVDALTGQVTELKAARLKDEEIRLQLFSKLQDLTGAVRVFVRLRGGGAPNENYEVQGYDGTQTEDLEDRRGRLLVHSHSATVDGATRKDTKSFNFDSVLDRTASQEECFAQFQPLLRGMLHGYNVTCFAYGQTGSGKTYTMLQKENGMVPLALRYLLEQETPKLQERGWQLHFRASFLEVHNDKLRDLLCPTTPSDQLQIRHLANDTVVQGAKTLAVSSLSQATDILSDAMAKRATASTKQNAESSRSHAVFLLRLRASRGTERRQSTLAMVDLAGSERINRSQATGDTKKEAVHINKSLSALSAVVQKVANTSGGSDSTAHVPYRDSALTWLLKNSLGGGAKTAFFITLSPLETDKKESLNTLIFASLLTKVHTGSTKRRYTFEPTTPKTPRRRSVVPKVPMPVPASSARKARRNSVSSKAGRVPVPVAAVPGSTASASNSSSVRTAVSNNAGSKGRTKATTTARAMPARATPARTTPVRRRFRRSQQSKSQPQQSKSHPQQARRKQSQFLSPVPAQIQTLAHADSDASKAPVRAENDKSTANKAMAPPTPAPHGTAKGKRPGHGRSFFGRAISAMGL